MRPESHARALRGVIAELTQTVTATTFLAKKISGVWQRYDLPGDHPLTGRSAPDLVLSDGSRLAAHLRGGRALLLDLADDPDLRKRAAGYGDRVQVVTAACPERPALAGLLIRPDGCTAWAADVPDGSPLDPLAPVAPVDAAGPSGAVDPSRPVSGSPDAPASLDELDAALRLWFGTPDEPVA